MSRLALFALCVIFAPLAGLTAPIEELTDSTLHGQLHGTGNRLHKKTAIVLTPLDRQVLEHTRQRRNLELDTSGFTETFHVLTSPVKLIIRNPGHETHNVYCPRKIKPFDLGLMSHDDVGKAIDIETSGHLQLYCSIHKHDRTDILVFKDELAATLGENGFFSIDGLKPGRWRLRTVQVDPITKEIDTIITFPLTEPLRLKWPD